MDSRNSANPIEHARNVFHGAGGTLRAGQARARGVHPRTLSQMVDGGQLIRISRGLYQLPEATEGDPDLTVVALKVPTGVVCLISALAIHELTTQIPHAVDVALPHGTTPPKLAHPPVHYYRFGEASMAAGVEDRDVGGTMIRVFDAPKSVADCFKFRNKIGMDVAIEALRTYLRRRGASVDTLLRYADINRVRSVMMPYIEAVFG
ncbi:MAG: type IV toxin-antitoxin system AbiEi family antitoxin domain-containing protein [Phycisphaerales bacterium JB054]